MKRYVLNREYLCISVTYMVALFKHQCELLATLNKITANREPKYYQIFLFDILSSI